MVNFGNVNNVYYHFIARLPNSDYAFYQIIAQIEAGTEGFDLTAVLLDMLVNRGKSDSLSKANAAPRSRREGDDLGIYVEKGRNLYVLQLAKADEVLDDGTMADTLARFATDAPPMAPMFSRVPGVADIIENAALVWADAGGVTSCAFGDLNGQQTIPDDAMLVFAVDYAKYKALSDSWAKVCSHVYYKDGPVPDQPDENLQAKIPCTLDLIDRNTNLPISSIDFVKKTARGGFKFFHHGGIHVPPSFNLLIEY